MIKKGFCKDFLTQQILRIIFFSQFFLTNALLRILSMSVQPTRIASTQQVSSWARLKCLFALVFLKVILFGKASNNNY